MSMLTQYQIELIHREIDGENTPDASAEARELVATQPEALMLMTSLQSLDAVFREVPHRELSDASRQAIHNAMSINLNAGNPNGVTRAVTRWAIQQWHGVSTFMGESMLTKKVLLVATTAVAVIAIIGNAVVGYPPSIFDAGTIGAGDGMSGVQQAGRYQGSKKTDADVTLSNPEIQALLQNDQILRLVKSDMFRTIMRDDASRQILQSDALRMVLSSEAALRIFQSDAFRTVLSNDASLKVFQSDAFRMVNANASYQELMATPAYQDLMAMPAYRQLLSSESFRAIMANDSFRQLLANESFRLLLANESFRALYANESFRSIMASESFRAIMASEAFRQVARDQSLSEAFLNEAARVAP
jgi:hypothetical protein